MRRRSGVSYLITVVLMTLVAVALGTLLYAYFSGWIGSRTGSLAGPVGVLSVEEAYYDSANTQFVVYVRNDGVGTVTIENAYVTAPDGTVYTASNIGTDVAPGSTATVTLSTTTLGITTVNSGIWTIKLVANDGSSVTTTVRV